MNVIESEVVDEAPEHGSPVPLNLLFDAHPLPVFVVDEHRRVRLLNDPAHRLIEGGHALAITDGGVLHGRSVSSRRALDTLFPSHNGNGTSLRQSIALPAYSVIHGESASAPTLLRLEALSAEHLCLYVLNPEQAPAPGLSTLRSIFGLTPAEAELAQALARGATLDSYGVTRGVSRSTVKTQLAQIMEKTGTNRQTALLRLLYLVGLTPQRGDEIAATKGYRQPNVWGR